METTNDKWSHLSGPVMDSLIAELQRLGRWRRDGPNLRCLNKHWREQVDIRITHIRPIGMDASYSEGLESLSKMSNLRHLRLEPFLARRYLFETPESLISRLNCLSKLTKLTDLELNDGLSQSSYIIPDECCQTVRLCPSQFFQNVTSVVFYDVSFPESQSVSFLESAPLRELKLIGISCCQYFNCPWFDALKSLEFVTDRVSPDFTKEITKLVSLESLSISSKTIDSLTLENAENLSLLTSLVSLHLPDSEIEFPHWLTTLSNLQSLSLRISDYESNEERIWKLLESFHSLKSLFLPHRIIKVQSFLTFYNNAENLRSLEFLAPSGMEDNRLTVFTQLSRLTIDFCDTRAVVQNLVKLPSLKELSLRGEAALASIFDKSHVSSLRNLIMLEIDWCALDCIIQEIILIRTLKKLCFYRSSPISVNAISELRKLPDLKELCLIGACCGMGIKQTPQLESLFDNLELLCFTHSRCKSYSCQWIYNGFSHVKITESLEEFQNHSCIGQKTRRPKWTRS